MYRQVTFLCKGFVHRELKLDGARYKVQLKIPITTKRSSALVAHLERVPRIESNAVGLIVGSIPSPDLCERNTFGGVQQNYGLRGLVSYMNF